MYSKDDKYIIKMKFYPAILFICLFWASVRFIAEFFEYSNYNIPWLVFLHFFFGSLQGFFNFVFYGLNQEVKTVFKNIFFKRCCSCFARKICMDKKKEGIELDETRRESKFTEELYTEEGSDERYRSDSSQIYSFTSNENNCSYLKE
jgi:hypothetical protein